jgi:hypothetical protein
VYGLLKEAEHRSTFYIPYWDLPLARCLFVHVLLYSGRHCMAELFVALST